VPLNTDQAEPRTGLGRLKKKKTQQGVVKLQGQKPGEQKAWEEVEAEAARRWKLWWGENKMCSLK